MVRLLKLSNNRDEVLSSEDILAIHLGYFLIHGKVTISTNIPFAEKPGYVLLTLGNVNDICYLCKVADYSYKDDIKAKSLLAYAPDVYKNQERNTLLLFDFMQKIPVDFLDELLSNDTMTMIKDFICQRANNKIL